MCWFTCRSAVEDAKWPLPLLAEDSTRPDAAFRLSNSPTTGDGVSLPPKLPAGHSSNAVQGYVLLVATCSQARSVHDSVDSDIKKWKTTKRIVNEFVDFVAADRRSSTSQSACDKFKAPA